MPPQEEVGIFDLKGIKEAAFPGKAHTLLQGY